MGTANMPAILPIHGRGSRARKVVLVRPSTITTAGAVGELPVGEVLLIAHHRSSARILLLRVAKETQGGERNVHSAPRPDQAD